MKRVRCHVPGCRRTIDPGEHPAHWNRFLCPGHWRLVSAAVKRVKRRHEREFKKYGFYPREEAYRRICARMYRETGA